MLFVSIPSHCPSFVEYGEFWIFHKMSKLNVIFGWFLYIWQVDILLILTWNWMIFFELIRIWCLYCIPTFRFSLNMYLINFQNLKILSFRQILVKQTPKTSPKLPKNMTLDLQNMLFGSSPSHCASFVEFGEFWIFHKMSKLSLIFFISDKLISCSYLHEIGWFFLKWLEYDAFIAFQHFVSA